MRPAGRLDRRGLSDLSEAFEVRAADDIVAWACSQFGDRLALASSFQDCVLVDVATRVAPGIEVVFLDTGFHFAATLEFVERVRQRYHLDLQIVRPEVRRDAWPCGSERCCDVRKVEPLRRVLAERDVWISGLRRAETPERVDTPIVSWDVRNGAVKVNPLARWSDEDVTRYEREYDLPVHPLRAEGYWSIGCAPTTGPVSSDEHPRAGRWPGSERSECGLHL